MWFFICIFAFSTFKNRRTMNLIEEFLGYLRLELNYSALTVDAYRLDLTQWAEFATDRHPEELSPMDITTSDLRQWIGSLARKGCTPRTIRRKSSALRAFFRYLMRNHGLTSNPASELTLTKTAKTLPVYIRPNETAAILDEMDSTPSADFSDTRDRLILEMFYATGMRCQELIDLLDINVDTTRRELKVHGKRNKERIIPFAGELAEAIDHYRTVRDSNPATAISSRDREARFFVRKNGEPIYRKLAYKVVHEALALGGAHASRLSPHVLRHSFATDMLNNGASISSVQQLLGHASLASTQVYTHITYRELKHNYQLAHPRALKKGGKHGN